LVILDTRICGFSSPIALGEKMTNRFRPINVYEGPTQIGKKLYNGTEQLSNLYNTSTL